MPKLQRIQTADRVLNMIQDNVSNILDPYSSKEILQGQILQNIELASGANTVAHKLNRKLLPQITSSLLQHQQHTTYSQEMK